MTQQEEREKRFADFVKEFVNDHGTEWRPLRGLWPDNVASFWEKQIDLAVAEERKRIVGMVNCIETDGTDSQAYVVEEILSLITKDE